MQICAVLHDVVEDTKTTFEDLRAEGFMEEIIAALDCLTRRDGENYDDYIIRILTNTLACKVKNGGLADNMDLIRIPNPTDKDKERIEKYRKAADRIYEVLPYSDAILNCRLIEVNGVAEVPPNITADQFNDVFIRFIEAHGWFLGGGFKDVTNEEMPETEE
jgi:hypothetical protein